MLIPKENGTLKMYYKTLKINIIHITYNVKKYIQLYVQYVQICTNMYN